MLLGSRGSRIRCLLVWTAITAATGSVGAVALPPARDLADGAALGDTPLDVVLTELAAVVLLGCTAWLWLTATAVVAEAGWRPGTGRPGVRGVPAGVRRVVLAACGVALAGGLTAPSHAAPGSGQQPGHLEVLTGLPLPDRAVAGPAHRRRQRTVLVQPGDSLWSLAADDLPAGSPDQLIDARWRALYAANRALIGPDPDVIVPGQHLRLPGKDSS